MSSWQVPGYSEYHELGRGSFGRVVAATNEASGRLVAIKYLNSDLFGDPEFLASFREEARLLAELDVPQVVKVLTYVEEPGRGAAIVMELVDGVSLHELITRQGPTQPESALAVLKGSLLGLASAHALGVVHRDYKPENVLVDAEGISKLTDFGLATRAGRQVRAAGTPLYMAPEQWAGQPASPAADIYAATAVFFECLTGRPPFDKPIGQLREQHEQAPVPSAEVDEPFRALLERGMAKDPADRPPDAAAFVFELESAAQAAAGPDWEERGRGQLKERVAALLLLLVGGTAGSSGTAAATTWLGRHKAAVLTTAAAVVVTTLVAGGIAVASNSGPPHQPPPGNGITVVSQPVVGASATVVPPTAAVSCATPASFTYAAMLTVSQPGPVSYRWIYSSGTPGPLHTLQASHAGSYQVSGGDVQASTTGTGWAEVQVTSPLSVTSNKATYQLTCGTPAVTISLGIQPASPDRVQCGATPPTFTIHGQIKSSVAGQLGYHWVRSNGTQTAAQTVSVSAGQTVNVADSVTAASDAYSGSDTLQVSSPVATSQSIPITVTCTAAPPPPSSTPSSPPPSPPPSSPPPPPASHVTSVTVSIPTLSTKFCSGAVQTVTGSFTIMIDASSTTAVQLSWKTFQNGTTEDSPPSQSLSGQTSYTVTVSNAAFGSLPAGGACEGGTFFAAATATGSDGITVTADSGSVIIPTS